LGEDFNMAFGCEQPKLTIDDPRGTARMARFTANEASIAVTSPAGGRLTYRDAWTPAWQAAVDGLPVPLERNRDGFKTLVVPPGQHRVDLAFRPLVGERPLAGIALILTLSLLAQIWLACAGPRFQSPPLPE
jgi:hypothetical protein